MITRYKKIDSTNYYIYVEEHQFEGFDDTDPIGLVSQDYFGKKNWKITSYFSCMIEDTYIINDSYFSSIEAGRALVKAWENAMWFLDSADNSSEKDFFDFSWPNIIKTS
jgi:hypothetical protein